MIDRLTVDNVDYNILCRYNFNPKEEIPQETVDMLKHKHNAEKIIIANYGEKVTLMLANIIKEVLPLKEDAI